METQDVKPNGAPPPAAQQAPPTPTPSSSEPPKRSLVRKLSEVMGAVERVAKSGRNEFHKYAYVTEADLADAIRGELAKRQVFIFPTIRKCVRSPLDVETTKWENNQKVASVRKTQLTEIEVEWTFVDGESGEERTIVVHGVGEDNVDKGFYKAFTGSEKYMLMKSFLVPTGDDPEQDSKEERREAAKEGNQSAQNVAKKQLEEKAKSPDPKIRQMAQDGLAAIRAKEQGGGDLTGALKESIAQAPKNNGVTKAHIPIQESLESAKNDGLFDEIVGTILEVREMQTTPAKGNKPYRRIAFTKFNKADGELKDVELVSWDNLALSDGKLWDYLKGSEESPAIFLCEVGEYKGKTSYTVRDVKAIGSHSWDARVGAIQQGLR